MANVDERLRIVVLGAPGVGKSAVISQFMDKDRLQRHWFTIELEEHCKAVNHKGRQIALEVIDTPGGYCFQARRWMTIETGDAFILVFSLEDECSFETVAMMKDDILRVKKKKKVPILLVGNKNDVKEERRITGVEGAKLFAKKEWNTKYVDTCAMDKGSVNEVFQAVMKLAKLRININGSQLMRRMTWPRSGMKKTETPGLRRDTIA